MSPDIEEDFRLSGKLSEESVATLNTYGDHLDSRGLYLQVRSKTSKSWLLKYSIDKRAREMGLGSAFDVSLKEARSKRIELRKLIKRGIDPLEQRDAAKQAKKLDKAQVATGIGLTASQKKNAAFKALKELGLVA